MHNHMFCTSNRQISQSENRWKGQKKNNGLVKVHHSVTSVSINLTLFQISELYSAALRAGQSGSVQSRVWPALKLFYKSYVLLMRLSKSALPSKGKERKNENDSTILWFGSNPSPLHATC